MNEIETLYRQHASAVFRFALGLSGNRAAAEDIVSDTFVRLLTKAPRIETRTARAYLFIIARHVFLNNLRRQSREASLDEDPSAPPEDPAARIDGRARLGTVLGALRSLPEHERAALLLRVDHELAYDDIAAALGAKVGTVKVWVHRARVRLAALSHQEGDCHETRRHP